MKVFDDMIRNKVNYHIVDPWVSGQDAYFEELEKSDVSGKLEYNGEVFHVAYESGGGVGMGEYPATYTIAMLRKFY